MNDVFMKMREPQPGSAQSSTLQPSPRSFLSQRTSSLTQNTTPHDIYNSQRDRLINDAYRCCMCEIYLSWQGGDVEPKIQRKTLISPANSFDLHYAGLSYKDATAIKENQNLSEKKEAYYFNQYQKWHHPLPSPGYSYNSVACLIRKEQ